MTKKDYIVLANALASVKPTDETNYKDVCETQWQDDVRVIARVLAADNSRFDGPRFFAVCGYV
jgi:hypothetical protein